MVGLWVLMIVQLVLLITVYTGQNMKADLDVYDLNCVGTTGSATEYTDGYNPTGQMFVGHLPEQSLLNEYCQCRVDNNVNRRVLNTDDDNYLNMFDLLGSLHPSHRMCDYAVYCVCLALGHEIFWKIFHLVVDGSDSRSHGYNGSLAHLGGSGKRRWCSHWICCGFRPVSLVQTSDRQSCWRNFGDRF